LNLSDEQLFCGQLTVFLSYSSKLRAQLSLTSIAFGYSNVDQTISSVFELFFVVVRRSFLQ
jgi:hypothetical protein